MGISGIAPEVPIFFYEFINRCIGNLGYGVNYV